MKTPRLLSVIVLSLSVTAGFADDEKGDGGPCNGLPSASQLATLLKGAPALVEPGIAPAGGMVGGLFNGARMWGAVVNRDGTLCAIAASTSDASQVWPGSQAIAKAKAYTANAFSLDTFVLSTARLYTFTQPGHSLNSLGQSNPFDPSLLAPPSGKSGGVNQITGGMIFFGGGVPIYQNGKIVGGLGVSGDTSCADHEIAKRVRHMAGLDPVGGPVVDDITYTIPDGPGAFTHPKCINTWRNGVQLAGTEPPASGY